jgi:tetratricopeptide (TPR) repeat protein
MRRLPALIAALSLALPAAAAEPVRDPDACAARVAQDPARGLEAAREWSRFGGGASAAVCEALALERLGAFSAAAGRLEELARDAPAETYDAGQRAELLELAAGFRLRGGAPAAALKAAESGIALAPGRAGLRRLRGEALAELGRGAAARGALDAALSRDPGDLAARLLRARLRREAGDAAGARDDARAARDIAPEAPRAWLELGAAEAALGARAAARESLLRAIELDREGPVGARARVVLQRMDAAPD